MNHQHAKRTYEVIENDFPSISKERLNQMNEIDKNELMNKISESVLKKGKDNKDTE